MNKVILVGRLTKDPEVKTTQSQVPFCSFTIAVDRKFKSASGERQSDFLNCIAWRQQASFLGQYFQKGSRIAVIGNLQSRSYDDADGKKRYVTEVMVDEIEFVDTKRDSATASSSAPAYAESMDQEAPPVQAHVPAPVIDGGGFYPAMDDDTTLPFDL